MLSEEGEEKYEDGINDCASLNTDLLTSLAADFLSKHDDEFLIKIANGKYGVMEEGEVLEEIYHQSL